MSRSLVIFGAGGHGREILQLVSDIVENGGDWTVLGFAVSHTPPADAECVGLPVHAWSRWARYRPHVTIAIGQGASRRKIAAHISTDTAGFPALVHPSAVIGRRIRQGQGTQIAAGAILTVDIALGNHVLINRASNVSHDCIIGNYCTLAPICSLSGAVTMEEGAELGTGALVLPGISIGAWSVIGAGSVVTRTVAANVVAFGAPARVVRASDEQVTKSSRTEV